MTTIYLHGAAGKKFGTIWNLEISRVSEAIRAICFLKPAFREYMRECTANGVAFRVTTEAGSIGEEQLHLPATKVIHIRPIVQGSKRQGVFQIIIGVVLIVASFYMGNPAGVKAGADVAAGSAAAAAATTGSKLALFAFSTGVSMLAGGVSALLANPKGDYVNEDEKRSYLFGGPRRSTTQGIALPLGYGRLHVGGIPISTDLVSGQLQWSNNYGTDGAYLGGSPNDPMDGQNPDLNYWGWTPSGGPGDPGSPTNPYVPPAVLPTLPDIDDVP